MDLSNTVLEKKEKGKKIKKEKERSWRDITGSSREQKLRKGQG